VASTYFLEIAASTVRAGCVEGSGKKARLSSYYEERLNVEDGDLPRVLPSLIQSIASRIKISGSNLVVGISSRYLIFREATTPFSDRKKAAKTLPFAIEEHVSVPIDEIVIDAFELSRTAGSSTWYCCCAPKKLLRAINEGCAEIGCDPSIVAPSFAGLPFALPDPETKLIVDIGHDTTDIVLTKGDNLLFSRSLRLAGRSLTRAISEALSLEAAVAEDTKHLSAGVNDRDSSMKDIFTSELTRLAREIRLTISSLPADKTPSSVKLIGGGAAIQGIAEFLTERLSIPCAALKKDELLGVASILNKPATSGFLAPAGLAEAENSGGRPCVNFRRDDFSYHGVFDRIAMPLLIMLVFLTAITAVFAWHFSTERGNAAKARDAVTAQAAKWWEQVFGKDTKPPDSMEKYTAFVDEKRKKLSEEEKLRAKSYIGSVLPHMRNLEALMAGINFRLVRISADKANITLEGEVDETDLAKMHDLRLRSSSYFSDVVLDSEQQISGTGGGYRFTYRFIYRK